MANQKISELPRKYALSPNDIVPIVDSQFGSANYVNKKATIGDILGLTQLVITNEIVALNPGNHCKRFGGIVLLGLSNLDETNIVNPENEDVLVYDAGVSNWENKQISEMNFVLDSGEF